MSTLARLTKPNIFLHESYRLPVVFTPAGGEVRDVIQQLLAIHHSLEDARRTGNWQAVYLAEQDLGLVLSNLEEAPV